MTVDVTQELEETPEEYAERHRRVLLDLLDSPRARHGFAEGFDEPPVPLW